MIRRPTSLLRSASLWVVLGCSLLSGGAGKAQAKGQRLDGRMAPDLAFRGGGLFGITPATRLSAFRGRPVLVKFWLRDCPKCRRSLPRLQDLHDRFGQRGLMVIAVLHEHGPKAASAAMREFGYDFPVACDVDGSQARRYGVEQRPADYLIGTDGRVKASNKVTDEAISRELGKYRLGQVDPLPAAFKAVRDAIWRGQVGSALELAQRSAHGNRKDADLAAAAARVLALAKEDLRARVRLAERLAARKQVPAGRKVLTLLVSEYRPTSLAATAKQRLVAYASRHPVTRR